MEYVIVKSESSDWYVIPLSKLEEWNESVMYEYDGEEDWVRYIPGHDAISFSEYKKIP